jgi:hypothetical protein
MLYMIPVLVYAITYYLYGAAMASKALTYSLAGILFLKWVHTGELPEGEIE